MLSTYRNDTPPIDHLVESPDYPSREDGCVSGSRFVHILKFTIFLDPILLDFSAPLRLFGGVSTSPVPGTLLLGGYGPLLHTVLQCFGGKTLEGYGRVLQSFTINSNRQEESFLWVHWQERTHKPLDYHFNDNDCRKAIVYFLGFYNKVHQCG